MKKVSKRKDILKVITLADIHIGSNLSTSFGRQGFETLSKFVEIINRYFKPNCVIELGDRVASLDLEEDKSNSIKLRNILENIHAPVFYLLGNHDIEEMTVKENEEIYNCSFANRIEYINGFRLMLLNAQDPVVEKIGGSISEEQIKWIRSKLIIKNAPTLVFSHQAIDDQEIISNINFFKIPKLAFVRNKETLRDIFNSSQNVLAVINGHLHWSNIWIKFNVPYISVPSFIETWGKNKKIPGAFSEIIIRSDGIDISFYIINPFLRLSRVSYIYNQK